MSFSQTSSFEFKPPLSLVERKLIGSHAKYEKLAPRSFKLDFYSVFSGNTLPIVVTEYEAWIVAAMTFPKGTHALKDPEEFLHFVNGLTSSFVLGLDVQSNTFKMEKNIPQATFWVDVTNLAFPCDTMFPLLQEVGRTGKWSPELVNFFLSSAKEFASHS